MKVAAVVVCFHPDLDRLRHTCDGVIGAGASVVLVDNTEPAVLDGTDRFTDCIVHVAHENTGIARAQNIGTRLARGHGAQAVVFFDQDSVVEPGFLTTLLSPLQPGRPGVVAPVSTSVDGRFEYMPTRIRWPGWQEKVPGAGRTVPYRVDIVISSGTAATIEALDIVGGMDEELFIDYVDLEWCLRCRMRHVPIQVVPAAVMRHAVGGAAVALGFARVLVHSPARSYYQIRNCCRLFRKDSVPLLVAIREALVLAAHKLLSLVVVPQRRAYLAAYAAGVRDGMRGIAGRMPSPPTPEQGA